MSHSQPNFPGGKNNYCFPKIICLIMKMSNQKLQVGNLHVIEKHFGIGGHPLQSPKQNTLKD